MKHILGFSGGIDSQAVYCWLADRFPAEDIILLHSNAGKNESPLNDDFVERFSSTVHSVILTNALVSDMWDTPGLAESKGLDGNAVLDFVTMAEIKKRFPSRKAQFCTEKLKLVPMRRWLQNNPLDGDYERYTGVRRDESDKRSETPLREWDSFFDCYTNHPLADWSKKQCFDFVKEHGQEINPLYTMGFSRVGCMPCINANKSEILQIAERFPEIIDKIREWEKRVGRTYFAPILPGDVYGSIDEIVEWSKTDRGGRQYNLFLQIAERPNCQSKYGLCE